MSGPEHATDKMLDEIKELNEIIQKAKSWSDRLGFSVTSGQFIEMRYELDQILLGKEYKPTVEYTEKR